MHFDLLSALIGLVAGKAKPEYFSNTVKSMKETEKYITDFWNADKDQ